MSDDTVRPRIRWHRPSPRALRDSLNLEAVRAEPARNRQLELLAEIGIPIVEGAETAKEFALELLKVAAEVEHALMVQYLYTAYSISTEASGQGYRHKLRNIAIQEMGHLATVQNLLLLLGGPQAFHMQRDVLRKNSDKNAIPFVLEPVSRAVLAKYVAAEVPATPPPELAEKVAALLALAQREAGTELNRVGAIYALLEWMFMDKDEALKLMDVASMAPLPPNPHLLDTDLQPLPVIESHEARPLEWGDDSETFLLETVHSRAEAVPAIRRIAAQGEGMGDSPHSHFHEFMQLVDAFDQNKITIREIAISPDLGSGHGGEKPATIKNSYTRLWGEIVSLQYTLLVLSIHHALTIPRTTDEAINLRSKLADLALQGMRRFIDPLSEIMTGLPMDNDPKKPAGPPFDLDPETLVFSDPAQLPDRHLALLARLAELYQQAEAAPEFGLPENSEHATAIANLRALDRKRKKLLAP